ncbi:16S rRNA (adenine(1518)-N(6)/adenine(1519)-N(6))-dimethyltransferase RsmA [Acholeplasma hippikon]|uniref:Ribosomal RNA small subunit methyltransferase A n=1 Tax=Acholeplasma hippikon TaxID=264636 RepID=A0A449BKM5_9MOLU|nr:16S rRNA (adenine(1518)-N(6)/adenine(1519)-N(6))-dimethyltransferase RsmA [Acholeplasma hippikon]VEU83021.1 dimethyladenosine transferase [Acholeplasma hippikon]
MEHQAKKKFGQNFLTDTNLLKKIVDSANIKDKNVLEIGPGLGALTQFLTVQSKKYLAYEIDLSLVDTLKKFESEKAQFIFKDFMEDDVTKTLLNYFQNEEVHLVGNLPYYITTPIIFEFLKYDHLKTATIMVQKEVGDRIISDRNLKTYNGFSAILQYYTKVSRVVNVNRKMFNPVPKVDSMVVKLEKIDRRLPKEQEILYEKIVKSAFMHKRKTMVNNLSETFNIPKIELQQFLNKLGFKETARAEELSVEDFILITKSFNY